MLSPCVDDVCSYRQAVGRLKFIPGPDTLVSLLEVLIILVISLTDTEIIHSRKVNRRILPPFFNSSNIVVDHVFLVRIDIYETTVKD